MSKTSTIRARMEPDLKGKVEHIFQQLGLTTTYFINRLSCKKGFHLMSQFPIKLLSKLFQIQILEEIWSFAKMWMTCLKNWESNAYALIYKAI